VAWPETSGENPRCVSRASRASSPRAHSSPSPGVCHIELIFATGFTYSTDVMFNSQEGECASSNVPILGPFTVNNPSDTCVALDAGGDE
jgi:hypothetical protein